MTREFEVLPFISSPVGQKNAIQNGLLLKLKQPIAGGEDGIMTASSMSMSQIWMIPCIGQGTRLICYKITGEREEEEIS